MPTFLGSPETGPVFIKGDGGGGTSTQAELYFYLVFNTLNSKLIPVEDEQLFYKTGLEFGAGLHIHCNRYWNGYAG